MPAREAKPYRNGGRYWGNFSKYAAVGGKREQLKVRGETVATRDYATAVKLFADRKAQYEQALLRAALGLLPEIRPVDGPTLVECAEEFLKVRAEKVDTNGNAVDRERRWNQRKLGIMTCLNTVRLQKVKYIDLLKASDIDAMIAELLTRPTKTGAPLCASTVRGYVMEFRKMITGLYKKGRLAQHPFAHAEMVPEEAEPSALDTNLFLDRDEVRRLLDAVVNSAQIPYAVELVSVLAYTGMRKEEATGLLVGDVDLENGMIHVRANHHRKGKTKAARREIPLWPRLRQRLEALVRGKPAGALVFPSMVATRRTSAKRNEQPVDAIDGTLSAAARRAGLTKHVTHHTLRHSYASARLQMQHKTITGHLVPVDREMLVKEIGHSDAEVLKIVYAHITRDRSGQLLLDYGEQELSSADRAKIGQTEQSARRAAGYAARAARRQAGIVVEPLPSTDEEKAERQRLARTIRDHVRAQGWTPQVAEERLGASPADITAIIRGDLSRLPLSRVRMYSEATGRP